MSGGWASKKNMASGRMLGTVSPATDHSGNKIRKQTKMRISFRQKLRAWLFEENNDSELVLGSDNDDDGRIESESSIHFTVTNASGGRIVQVRHYDRKADRNMHKLHIITPDEDLPTALAHILAIETIGK
jgi:hypothetical protein